MELLFSKLPQNSGVSRFGERGIIVRFSDLQENWSPSFYDFTISYKIILEVFKHTRPENLLNKWENMKTNGFSWDELCQTEYKCRAYVRQKLNPKLIELVDSIIYG